MQSSALPTVLVNSVPKSGTHMLARLVCSFPGMQEMECRFESRHESVNAGAVPIGVGRPRLVARHDVERTLRTLPPGSLAPVHVPYSQSLAELLELLGMRMVTIIRDPRDVAISHADYMAKLPLGEDWHANALRRHYETLSEKERLTTSLVGIQPEHDGAMLLGMRDRLTSVLPWTASAQNYTTRFEWLVGPRGGGTREAQLREIRAIGAHLHFALSDAAVEDLAENLFGSSPTFNRGVLGTWRARFDADHKRICKESLGQLLIDLGYEQDLDW